MNERRKGERRVRSDGSPKVLIKRFGGDRRKAAQPCPNKDMGEHACSNKAQCWEPCGDLGHDESFVAVVPTPAETPRTDAEAARWAGGYVEDYAPTSFARQLERELAAKDAEIAELKDWKNAALVAGEHLAPDGPSGYYNFVPVKWLSWARVTADQLNALRAESEDAARYRWLRQQHWSESAMCVVSDPKENVRLGVYCPSSELLDAAIDAALAAEGK